MTVAAVLRSAATSLLLATPLVHAAVVEEVAKVPVAIRDAAGRPVERDLVVTILRDDDRPRAPLLVLSHGRGPDRETMGRARFPLVARFFVDEGYLVVMPTRIGYGDTGGPDVETRGRGCANADFGAGFRVAADEVQQVIDWAVRRDDVEPMRIVAAGVSYGGATTLALAARNPPGLLAAINFSGGSGGDKDRRPRDPCNPDNVGETYAEFGRTTHVPELWMYASNDLLWGADIPKRWFARFREGGAPATFIAFGPVGDDGHALMNRGLRLWRADVRRFLADPAAPLAP